LPSLVHQSMCVGAEVFHKAVAVAVAVLFNPLKGPVRVRKQGIDDVIGEPPPAELTQHTDKQWGGISSAVIRGSAQREAGRHTKAHLVRDASGLLLGSV